MPLTLLLESLYSNKYGRPTFSEGYRRASCKSEHVSKDIKRKIGEDIVLWILRCADKEIDSVKAIGKDAMEERHYQMTGMGEENPDWIRACIVENYVAAKTYHFGKAKSEEVITMIVHWIQDNAPKTYKKSKKRLSNIQNNMKILFLNCAKK